MRKLEMYSADIPSETPLIVRRLFESLLESGQFAILESELDTQRFGNLRVTVGSVVFGIRYTRDRGTDYLEVVTSSDSFSIENVAEVVGSGSGDAALDLAGEVEYVSRHLRELEHALSDVNREFTLEKLVENRRERLRRMFPGGIDE